MRNAGADRRAGPEVDGCIGGWWGGHRAPDQLNANPRHGDVTLHPDQRVLPITELTEAETLHDYTFIVTNLDATTPDKAVAVEN